MRVSIYSARRTVNAKANRHAESSISQGPVVPNSDASNLRLQDERNADVMHLSSWHTWHTVAVLMDTVSAAGTIQLQLTNAAYMR